MHNYFYYLKFHQDQLRKMILPLLLLISEKKKLNISGTEFMHYCEQAGYKKLPIDEKHILALETLEKKENSPEHNDPFDRILLSQAKSETMNLLTCDKSFSYYNEPYYAIL